ncbi:DNA polymerase III subunit alpha [Paraliobacillus ryukyuensis]|uniref:DNA polymerase III subunit alpha n=1 Tax=Paraliobacillus ryukyuensis TaxID=200904 RepID=UPI0015C4563F|nr:DNA polymerase III subunit alpha [Paraliobacillus ryukyuensis]
MHNYVPYHLHSANSNPTAGTGADSVTKFIDYLDKAQSYGMEAFSFSEHGNQFEWTKKKAEIEKRGMKFIGANEVYLTQHNDKEKGLIRDNYHYMLLAKNWDGMKELNTLTSKSFNKDDGHFYYNPRITFDELKATSDNILMTSACLASPLWRMYKKAYPNQYEVNKEFEKELTDMLNFMEDNKHRMFFEIQYHNHPDQIAFNQMLLRWSKEMDIPLIAAGDTHSLNQEHADTREVFLKSKGASYGDEDTFDLTFKSFDEFVGMFEKQNALPRNIYLEAIHNTNVMADMVEEFTLNDEPKYPRLYDDSEKEFKERIRVGVKNRNVHKLPKNKKNDYFKRINEEFNTFKKLDAVDYMLLQDDIIKWCHKNDIYQGYSRGSVSGSIIAYLLGITDVDSIKWNMNFTRFMNKDRVTLADIDVDFPPSRRQDVIDYIAGIKGIDFCEIITFNTMALRGAIENIGRALKIPLPEVDKIKELADADYEKFKKKYPEVEKHTKIMNGVYESIGSHPSGFVVSPVNISEFFGLCKTKESKYAVSQINMKELEALKFLKLDVLGLDNMEIINETCELANIERLTPDNIDFEDENVWKAMKDDTVGVFQWESDSASRFIKQMFSEETLDNIKKSGIESTFLDLLSIGNGAIRPAGDSYRDKLSQGISEDNEHEVLNNFLENTLGQCIYQEQIMEFLVKFCGFTMGESDLVRRGLAKKTGTEEFIPKIKESFINTMVQKYGESKEHAEHLIEKFLIVIKNASGYGFSSNHSYPYSMIGYANAWLRYYYPLEFVTAFINVREKKSEKIAAITDYAKRNNIKINSIEFGKSKGKYALNKDEKTVYKGLGSIKYLNHKIADELFELSKNEYKTFTELLINIVEKTSVNTKQLDILIRLDFFKKFGDVERLLAIQNYFFNSKVCYKKTYVEKTKQKRIPELIKWEEESNDTLSFPVYERISFQKEHLGYSDLTFNVPNSHAIVVDVFAKFKNPVLTLYQLKTGREIKAKVKSRTFYSSNGEMCKVGDYIEILNSFTDYKWRKVGDKFEQDKSVKELFISKIRHIK